MYAYLDNAATTYPKPKEVLYAIFNYMNDIGASPGRGGYSAALQSDRLVFDCRETIARFFNFNKPENIIFTSNVTTSLNILIKSIVKEDWHVITTSMEHNSVLRPLFGLKNSGKIELDVINCSNEGIINIDDFKECINKNTKLVVMSHASNVIGTIQPIKEIGKICKKNDIIFILDSAQSAGVLPIDFLDLSLSALAFTGHKSLLGPQGIGGFIISDELNNIATPFIEGGTGSLSYSTSQPDCLPDKFESGTLNTVGIVGLLEGIKYINKRGLNDIYEEEKSLTSMFIEGLLNIPSISIYGTPNSTKRLSSISINSDKINNSEFGYTLDNEFGIMVRTGLHCAPLAHKTIGTFPTGTVRFSFGPFNDKKDISYALNSINSIIKRK